MEERFILVYACDYADDGKTLGQVTKARIDRAAEYVIEKKGEVTVLFTAGIDPEKPSTLPFTTLMATYLTVRLQQRAMDATVHFSFPSIEVAKHNHWGTFEETCAAHFFLTMIGRKEITIVSSQSHLRRIQLIWDLLGGVEVTAIGVRETGQKFEWFYEFIKTMKTYLDFFILRRHKKPKNNAW